MFGDHGETSERDTIQRKWVSRQEKNNFFFQIDSSSANRFPLSRIRADAALKLFNNEQEAWKKKKKKTQFFYPV